MRESLSAGSGNQEPLGREIALEALSFAGKGVISQPKKSIRASVFGAIRAIHDEITDSGLSKEFRADNPRPQALQLLLRMNLAAYRGIAEKIMESTLSGRQLRSLSTYVDRSIKLLEKDLSRTIADSRAQPLLVGLTNNEIQAITPTVGFPPIDSIAALQAYRFVLIGSNMGSVTTAKRLPAHFNVHTKSGGGVEFLTRCKSTIQVGLWLARVSVDMTRVCLQDGSSELMKSTAIQLMDRLKQGMLEASRDLNP